MTEHLKDKSTASNDYTPDTEYVKAIWAIADPNLGLSVPVRENAFDRWLKGVKEQERELALAEKHEPINSETVDKNTAELLNMANILTQREDRSSKRERIALIRDLAAALAKSEQELSEALRSVDHWKKSNEGQRIKFEQELAKMRNRLAAAGVAQIKLDDKLTEQAVTIEAVKSVPVHFINPLVAVVNVSDLEAALSSTINTEH